MKQGKVWGTTEFLYGTMFVEAHLLKIAKGGFCSVHKHERKENFLFVLDGELMVECWPEGTEENHKPDITTLNPFESMTILIGDWHRFRAVKDTTCIEIYSGFIKKDDIIRRTRGGLES